MDIYSFEKINVVQAILQRFYMRYKESEEFVK